MTKNIKLIIGSTRQGRVGKQIADWLVSIAETEGISLDVLDLQQIALPNFDAAVPPAYIPTQTEAGKAWQNMITEADGVVFLTPEYNRSIPSSLKNAIDYLAEEWKEKPASIVSYGYIDGGQSATKHLRDIFDWLKIKNVGEKIAIQLTQDMFSENGVLKNPDESLGKYRDLFTSSLSSIEKS